MAVKTYKKGESTKLSANFRVSEFDCNGKGCCTVTKIDDQLVTYLQKIRDHFGRSVNINSGYRCEAHNSSPKVGGSKGSHHVKGMAADIRVEGVAPAEVAKYAESIGIARIGLYDNFVHIGSDTKKRFWMGHEGTEVLTFGGATKTVFVELPVLKKGAKGSEVLTLQKLLVANGYNITLDGSLGAKTLNALECYQEDEGLEVDGSCGKATWSKLLGV
jgi:hypothetical protein